MKPSEIFPKYHPHLLIFIWLIVSILFFIYHGPKTMYDSYQYIEKAQALLNGEWIGFRYFWYVGYIGFLALLEWISNDVVLWSVVLQVLISGIAAIYVYKLTLLICRSKNTSFSTHQCLPVNDALPCHINITGGDVDDVYRGQIGHKLAAFVATLLFIGWYKIQVWNYFVLTESLFISLLVILFYAILKHQYKWQTLILLVLVIFIRPSGLIALVASVFGLVNTHIVFRNAKQKFLLIILVVFICGSILGWILENYDLQEPYIDGKIVLNADKVKTNNLQKGLFIHNDKSLMIPDSTGLSTWDSFRLFVMNPIYTIKLAGARVIYFIFDYRPYHSTVHIIVNTILLLICYGLTAIFFVKAKGQKLSKTWFLIFLIGNILMAGFTCLSWEGRFFAPLYPFLFIFSCCGGRYYLSKVEYIKQTLISFHSKVKMRCLFFVDIDHHRK